jgi:hypothetical protein
LQSGKIIIQWENEILIRNGGYMSDGVEAEFLPLPYYAWERRPPTVPLDPEECATALYLADGELEIAAATLKVEPLRLIRIIRRTPRLQRLHAELAGLLNDKVHHEYKRAFDSEDDRRREWAASKVSQTRQFQDHPLAPNTQSNAVVNVDASGVREIVFSWKSPGSPKTLDGSYSVDDNAVDE